MKLVKPERLYSSLSIFSKLVIRFRPFIAPFDKLIGFIPNNSSVLDIGTGKGLFLCLLNLNKNIKHSAGCDISPSSIKDAQTMAQNLKALKPSTSLSFSLTPEFSDWPDKTFDVVSMLDVMHHIPPAIQKQAFCVAHSKIKNNGIFLYKDMSNKPIFHNLWNRLHDLILAKQWINYTPKDSILLWAKELNLTLIHYEKINIFLYSHEIFLFKKN